MAIGNFTKHFKPLVHLYSSRKVVRRMKKILLFKRNNMNIILLIVITLVLMYNGFLNLLNYLFSLGDLGQNWFSDIFDKSMIASIAGTIFAVSAVISFWRSKNKVITPVIFVFAYAICFYLLSYWNDLFRLMPDENIFMLIFFILTISDYLWTHKTETSH